MKKGIIVNLKRIKLLDYVTLNKILILLALGFMTGILIGSLCLNKNVWLSQITSELFKNFISIHSNTVFIKKFFTCFLHYFIVFILYYLAGASMLGVITIPFITIWQGIITGNLTSFIYNQYGLSGIAFNAIILIPPIAVFVVSCFFAAKCAINFSLCIAKLTLPKSRPTNLFIEFKDYCVKYLIFILITCVCALIEIILSLLFFKFFNF